MVERRVLKFPLEMTTMQNIEVPAGAEILTVQMQHGALQMWALCPETTETWGQDVYMYGTGHTVHRYAGRYLGTVQMAGGDLIFHFFEGPSDR